MKNFKIGKRILAGVFAVAMSGLVPLSIVSAENQSSEITYKKSTTYTINIPASITAAGETITNQQITAAKTTNISGEKEVNVTVSSKFNGETNNLLLKRTEGTGGGKSVTTAVTLSGPSISQNVEVNKNNTLVATFQDQGTAPTYGGTLIFDDITGEHTDNNPIAAGTYTQELTFTITVEDRKH